MATFMPGASMNLCGLTLHARLEQLARSLTGKRSDKSAQMLVTLRVDLVVRVRANVRSILSPPLAPIPSSFGHDTPAPCSTSMPVSRARSAMDGQH
jgi:hypothetical protein